MKHLASSPQQHSEGVKPENLPPNFLAKMDLASSSLILSRDGPPSLHLSPPGFTLQSLAPGDNSVQKKQMRFPQKYDLVARIFLHSQLLCLFTSKSPMFISTQDSYAVGNKDVTLSHLIKHFIHLVLPSKNVTLTIFITTGARSTPHPEYQ